MAKKLGDSSRKPVSDLVASETTESRLVEDDESNLVSVPVDMLPVDIALPCSIYIKIGPKFPLFRKQGEKLTSKRMFDLTSKGAGFLFIHKAVWRVFLLALEEAKVPPDAPPGVVATHLRGLIIAYGMELERRLKEPKKPIFEKLRCLSERLAMAIKKDNTIAGHLLRKSRDPMAYFVNHSVNVAVYSTLIGLKLHFSDEELKTLAYASLVHDVGNLYLPKSLLWKTGELSNDDANTIQTHTRKGAELLQSLGSQPAVVLVAHQHHERIDGKGYPLGVRGEETHIFSRVVALADTYDALTSHKPYQAAMPPQQAIEKIRTLKGKFDPKIIVTITGAANETVGEFREGEIQRSRKV